MTWFVASILSVVSVLDGEQDEYPVWEDFILIEASNKEELDLKIDGHVKLIDAAGECQYKGKAAKQTCIGIRKIRSIYNLSDDIDQDPPSDGSELSHSFMVVDSMATARLLAAGKTATVTYVDDDD